MTEKRNDTKRNETHTEKKKDSERFFRRLFRKFNHILSNKKSFIKEKKKNNGYIKTNN